MLLVMISIWRHLGSLMATNPLLNLNTRPLALELHLESLLIRNPLLRRI